MNQMNIISDLIKWIENNLEKPLSIDHVAKKSGYSKWHLQRMFKEITGHILGTYIRHRRLTHAALALKLTSKPILDIAMQYRFDSQQTFTRSFKKQFNMTPALYRRCEFWDTRGLMPSIELGKNPVLVPMPILFHLEEQIFWGVSYKSRCNLSELLSEKKTFQEFFFRDYLKKCLKSETNFPCRIFSFTEPKPVRDNPDEQEIIYMIGLEEKKAIDGIHAFTPKSGMYAAFKYQGLSSLFLDFIAQIYLDMLPKLGLKRRKGPSIEIFQNCDKYAFHEGNFEVPEYLDSHYCVPVISDDPDMFVGIENGFSLFR